MHRYALRLIRKVTIFLLMVNESGLIEIPANDARVIVELPQGTVLELQDGKIIANKENIIAYK